MRTVTIKPTQPQADFHALTCKHPAFVGGFGCVHPETKIWTDEGLICMRDVKPLTRVLSWNEKNQKFQLSLSGGSYPKGRANLYRVATQQGVFDATSHHRVFSSKRNYQPVSSLTAGCEVKTASLDLLKTISELDLLSSLLDVQHYTKKDEDYLVYYATEARLYGLQLLKGQDIDLSYLPLLNDALISFQSFCRTESLQTDGLSERRLEHIHPDLSCDHQRKSHLKIQLQSLGFFSEGRKPTSSFEHTSDYLHKAQQSDPKFLSHHNNKRHSSDVHSFKNTLNNNRVLSIEDMGEEVYWDMQVLGTNNYVTECGVIHHNTGKTETMANQAFMDASHSSDALIGLYEPTYDLVRLIMAPRIEEKLQQYGIRYKYNKSENIIYSSNNQFGDFVLRTLDNPSRIIGYETYRSHVDEIDTLKEDKALEAWIKIIARNRQAPTGIESPFNRVSAYSTPEGFRFLYKHWRKQPRKGYEMIQASTLTNPFLPPDYVDTLKETYPPQLIEAYINGDFVNLTSGAVYTCYDRKLNNSHREITERDHLHIGMDFNVGKMSAVVHVKDKDCTHAVDELMGLLDTPAMIQAIKNRYPDHRITIYPDSSGKNRKSMDASQTDISQLRQHFNVLAPNRNPFVKDRIASVQAMLCNANNERRYFINESKCPETAEALEQQVYNKQGEPDKSHDNDHPNDALGYYIHNQYPIIKNTTHVQTMIV